MIDISTCNWKKNVVVTIQFATCRCYNEQCVAESRAKVKEKSSYNYFYHQPATATIFNLRKPCHDSGLNQILATRILSPYQGIPSSFSLNLSAFCAYDTWYTLETEIDKVEHYNTCISRLDIKHVKQIESLKGMEIIQYK